MRTVTTAYRDRGTTVVLDPDSVLPDLWGDRRMFKQMVMNLLSNAIKYTPGRGRIRVTGALADNGSFRQIGRASCRERVCQYVSISVVVVSLKKKQYTD